MPRRGGHCRTAAAAARTVAGVRLPLTPDQLLTTTRTVRKRLDLDRPVPLELIRECLTIALRAPSGSNRQHWDWVVVTDTDWRAAIGDYYRRAWAAYAASPAFAGAQGGDDPTRAQVQTRIGDSGWHLGRHMGDAPVLVLPCLRISSGSLAAGNQAGVWGSLLPAAWSYCLAARARGLGTAWTTLHLDYERKVADILGLPENVAQGALIPTAYYPGDTFQPAAREALDTVLHLDRW